MTIVLTVLVPALTALFAFAAARRAPRMAHTIAIVGAGLTVLAAIGSVLRDERGQSIATIGPLAVGDLDIPLHLHGGAPVPLIAAVVAVVSLCVQIYAANYLADDDRGGLFAAEVALFSAAMLLVVTSGDLVLTLIGWEVMGWCSYLLIGHWSRKESARRAAYKAFLVTRVADIGFVLGVVILLVGAGSSDYVAVLSHWTGLAPCPDGAACAMPDAGLRNLAMVLLVVGVLGKSAQFPFQDWLPDAMEGPTPASALIHAATMVAAGTFVLDQLAPVLVRAETARWVLAIAVAVTMFGAAVLAYGQSDLKRLLAWSTVSQVAIMLAPLAAGSEQEMYSSGVLHLYAHAWFKALLFLTIGWLGVIAGGTSAARLRGSARTNVMARMCFLGGLLALSGVPFLVGGVSKEHVLAVVWTGAQDGQPGGWIVLIALLATIVGTAAYATRAWLVISAADAHPQVVDDVPVTPQIGMAPAVAGVLGVLLAGTIFGGLVLFTDLIAIPHEVSLGFLLLAVLLIAIGAVLALLLREAPVRLGSIWDRGFGFDGLYRALVATPVLALARLVATVDDRAIDATARGTARLTEGAARRGAADHLSARPATGLAWVLGAAVVLGAVGAIAWR